MKTYVWGHLEISFEVLWTGFNSRGNAEIYCTEICGSLRLKPFLASSKRPMKSECRNLLHRNLWFVETQTVFGKQQEAHEKRMH